MTAESRSRSVHPPAQGHGKGQRLKTLCIDIGGTGTKMLVLDAKGSPINERARRLTPKPATPANVLKVIASMLPEQPAFDRVSVGFPGVVVRGTVKTAPNLGTEYWAGHDLGSSIQKIAKAPTRVLNDADLQGFGVIQKKGVELVLTLGTGVGAGLYTNGHLVANLELGHHPWRKGRTYEQRLSDVTLKRIGKKRWSRRVRSMIEQLEVIFNYDTLYIGGGNAEYLKAPLPKNVKIFVNVDGMKGGMRLWDDS